jgi:hypothetical protein
MPRTPRRLAAALIALCLLGASCSPTQRGTPWSRVAELTPPFLVDASAADPSLAVDPDGRVALTWVTRDSLGTDAWVAVSTDSGAHWSEPSRLNETSGRVSSFPESRPVAAWGPDGMLVTAWAAARETGKDADDIAVRVSADAGDSWGVARLVNDDRSDGSSTYHGFIAVDVLADGRPFVAWIDGRFSAGVDGEPHVADIFSSTSQDHGAHWTANSLVAGEVCPCCRLSVQSGVLADGSSSLAVGYRTAQDDLRDPRLAVSYDGGQTYDDDTLISEDRWKLDGCPSMGPAVTIEGERGQYFWYTGESSDDSRFPGRPAPGIYLVPWQRGTGASGPKRAIGDSLLDAARPMLARLDRGTLVAAIGKAVGRPERKVLAVRRLEPDGALSPWLYLGSAVKSGAVASQGTATAWAAWAELEGERTRVRVSRLTRR